MQPYRAVCFDFDYSLTVRRPPRATRFPYASPFRARYYGQGLNMREIGLKLGVDKSTVSRTIKRGEHRLQRCLRYGAKGLLES